VDSPGRQPRGESRSKLPFQPRRGGSTRTPAALLPPLRGWDENGNDTPSPQGLTPLAMYRRPSGAEDQKPEIDA
jgi:hypothetical protein